MNGEETNIHISRDIELRAAAHEDSVPKRVYIKSACRRSGTRRGAQDEGQWSFVGTQQSHSDPFRKRIIGELGKDDPRVVVDVVKIKEFLAMTVEDRMNKKARARRRRKVKVLVSPMRRLMERKNHCAGTKGMANDATRQGQTIAFAPGC